jgi:hypothetical protein
MDFRVCYERLKICMNRPQVTFMLQITPIEMLCTTQVAEVVSNAALCAEGGSAHQCDMSRNCIQRSQQWETHLTRVLSRASRTLETTWERPDELV